MSKKNFYKAALPLMVFAASSLFLSCKSQKSVTSTTPAVKQETPVANVPSGETLVLISTPYGDMKVRLYNETPQHRDNFIKLVEKGFYDSLLFHRVISNFMIQGGDPESKRANKDQMLGNGETGYTVPAEFNQKLFHKKGALCAARQGDDVNPNKASSGCQFYIVQGKKYSDADLSNFEMRINRPLLNQLSKQATEKPENAKLMEEINRLKKEGKMDSLRIKAKVIDDQVLEEYKKTTHYEFSPEQRNAYKTIGGTPHLDGNYTVFGEVYEGLEVIDKIAAVQTGSADRPAQDVRMKMKILKK
jgi:peptidylprolyl isomerase